MSIGKVQGPLFVYLDQNMWIGLARCFYGFDDALKHRPLLDKLLELARNDKIALPLSGVHLMETAVPENRDRRERLARFMIQMSRGLFIVPLMTVRRLEILQAVARKLGCRPITCVRDGVVRRGLPHAFGCELSIKGVSDGLKTELMALFDSDDVMVAMLVDAIDRGEVQAAQKDDAQAAEQLEEIRRRAQSNLSPDQREKVEFAGMLSEVAPIILDCLKSLGVPMKLFADSFAAPDQWMAFARDIPTLDVFATIGLGRDKQLDRPIHRNDLKDMGFLSMAIPYCEVVVCEKFFHHLVCSASLDTKYATTVLRSLDELWEWTKSAT
ncbi:MAG: hypothetical protein BIFFINMI_00575 [Phycisphaerae bacterium]|nr:hypothetical protein [Phycisphaerae bacterium]